MPRSMTSSRPNQRPTGTRPRRRWSGRSSTHLCGQSPSSSPETRSTPYVNGVHDVQVCVTPPPYPHQPGAGHLDGFRYQKEGGRQHLRSFTLLVGVILSDQTGDDMGNLHAWPGSHLEAADYARHHGVDAFVSAVMRNEAMPPVDFSAGSVQVHGAPGDVVFAHYLLAHNSGGNTSDVVRRTLYMRLKRAGHDERWRTFFTHPWADYDGVRPIAGP